MQSDDYVWDPKSKGDPGVARIEDALRPLRISRPPMSFDSVPLRRTPRWRFVAAAAVVAMLVGGYTIARLTTDPWSVRAITGSATVAQARVDASTRGNARISEGEWLETGPRSRAEMNVGRIGRAEFGPGSRVQLVRAEAREHRLSLAKGTMHARIWAPPRFFLVQTANALAVDLGCVYTLAVDDRGVGELMVESGEVEVIEGTRRALVPAGNLVSMKRGIGPGLPVRRSSSEEYRNAVNAVESSLNDSTALGRLLALSTSENSITLFHLLERVSADNRPRVYDRLVELVRSPVAVERSGVLALDRKALRLWKETLESDWTTETVPWWKRSWRRAWTFLLTVG